MDRQRIAIAVWGALCCLAFSSSSAQAAGPTDKAMVELNFPQPLKLVSLIEYISKRNGVNFLYDANAVANRQVTLIAAQKVPADSLMTLLGNILKMNGLMMYRDEAGLMRIEPAKAVTATTKGISTEADPSAAGQPTLAETRVVTLRNATCDQVEAVIRPFFQAATANVAKLDEQGLMIVTDYATNMPRLLELVAIVDRPKRQVATAFVPVQRMQAAVMAQQVTQMLQGQAKARGGKGGSDVTVLPDERTNRIVLIGTDESVREAGELIRSLDVSLERSKKIYALKVASAERVDRLIEKMLGEVEAKRSYQAAVDRESNLLVVTATPAVHEQIADLLEKMDKPVSATQSPIRFYKLENASALDVLTTLQSIEGTRGSRTSASTASRPRPRRTTTAW